MINGNGTIVYIDDIVNLCKRFNIEGISNFIIYSDNIDKIDSSNIKYENIVLYSNDVQKEFTIPQNVYGKFEFLFFVFDNNFLENIGKDTFFSRTKKLMKLRKYINLGMVDSFYSPDKIKVFNNNITINDLSTFKFFESDDNIDRMINKPIIELFGNNIKIINKDNFKIEKLGSGDINE